MFFSIRDMDLDPDLLGSAIILDSYVYRTKQISQRSTILPDRYLSNNKVCRFVGSGSSKKSIV